MWLFEEEKSTERFTSKDIGLSEKTLQEMETEEAETDDSRYDASDDDGSYEIGEDLKREAEGLPEIDKNKPTFDKDGFDEKGFNEAGFDKDGKDTDGNPEFSEAGFNKAGFDKDGKDKDGKPEFNKDGFNKTGYDKDGKTSDGRSEKDFTEGFDKDGFNPLGFNSDGKDKDGNTAPDEEISKEETSSSEDALVFSDIVDGKKEISIKTEDGKNLSLKDVLEVFTNQKKWNATNTQNAQDNKREKESVEATQQGYDKQNLEFKDTLELITKDAKFLDETDEYFGGEKKNPIRQLIETVNANQESVANRTKADADNATKFTQDSQKRADEELAQIIALDESYNNLTKVQGLYQIAEENKVGLMTAYKLQQAPILEEKLSTIEKTHKEATDVLDKKVADLTEELKKRNEKIQTLEKNPTLIEPDDDLDTAIGSDEEVESDNSLKSFDDVEKKYRKKFKID